MGNLPAAGVDQENKSRSIPSMLRRLRGHTPNLISLVISQ